MILEIPLGTVGTATPDQMTKMSLRVIVMLHLSRPNIFYSILFYTGKMGKMGYEYRY